jgi:hypothetical protein
MRCHPADLLLLSCLAIICFVPFVIQMGHAVGVDVERRSVPSWGSFSASQAVTRADGSVDRNLKDALHGYTREAFGFKRPLVQAAAWLQYDLLGESPSGRVILGDDSWLFLNERAGGRPSYSTLDDLRGRAVFPATGPKSAEAIADRIAVGAADCQRRGLPFLLVIAPEKSSVLQEHLPGWVRPGPAGTTRRERFLTVLRERHPSVPVLDLTPILRSATSAGQLYQRWDTHWTDLGAHPAYAAILAALRAQGLAVSEAQPIRAFTPKTEERPGGGDLLDLVGQAGSATESFPGLRPPRLLARSDHASERQVEALVRLSGGVADAPKLLMFRDSFAVRLVPMLSLHFREAVYRWALPDAPRYDPVLVESERPDAVIVQWVERALLASPERL